MTLTHAVSPDLEFSRRRAGATARAGRRAARGDRRPRSRRWAGSSRKPVASRSDLPGFDNSAMDGYAVRAHEIAAATSTAPVRLPVVGESRAGSVPGALAPGTAMRIMTGAPMPDGADTVVRQEDTSRDGATVLIEVATAARHERAPARRGHACRDDRAPSRARQLTQHRHRRRRGPRSRPASGGSRPRVAAARDRRRAGARGHAAGAGAARRTRTHRCSLRRFARRAACRPFSASRAIRRTRCGRCSRRRRAST